MGFSGGELELGYSSIACALERRLGAIVRVLAVDQVARRQWRLHAARLDRRQHGGDEAVVTRVIPF